MAQPIQLPTRDFVIEKAIPMPKGYGASKYPFGDLEVGDSFLIPLSVSHIRVRSSASAFGLRRGVTLSVRKDGDRYRVWRTA